MLIIIPLQLLHSVVAHDIIFDFFLLLQHIWIAKIIFWKTIVAELRPRILRVNILF